MQKAIDNCSTRIQIGNYETADYVLHEQYFTPPCQALTGY